MSGAASLEPGSVAVLLVDDRPDNLRAMEAVLSALGDGIDIVKAPSGEDALRFLLTHEVAVILLDVQMAGMDGFETAQLIRSRPRSEHTPLIFVTAFQRSPEDLLRGYALGAVDFIFKPLSPEILRSKVGVFVKLERQRQELTRQAALLREHERRAHEQSLRETTQRLQRQREEERLRLFTLCLDALCITHLDGPIKQVNPAFERIFGPVTPGRSLLDLVEEKDRPVAAAELEALRQGAPGVTFEGRSSCAEGTQRWFAWNATAYQAEGLFYAVGRDVTEQKRIEQLKNDFVSSVSHELRTPLTALCGSLKLLHHGVASTHPDRAAELLAIAVRSAERLARLVDDILDMGRIESGRLVFRIEPAALGPLLDQALQSNRPYAEQFEVGLRLRNELPEAVVRADADRLLQVLTNLIGNAAKFSPPQGEVELAARRGPLGVRIAVRDQGPGIPDSFRPRIFDRFAQVDTTNNRSIHGTGLGLSISKSLVDGMGGAIDFESEEGRGTTFFVDLPLADGSAGGPTPGGRLDAGPPSRENFS